MCTSFILCLLRLGGEGSDSTAKNVDNGRGERDEKKNIREGF